MRKGDEKVNAIDFETFKNERNYRASRKVDEKTMQKIRALKVKRLSEVKFAFF